MNKPDDEEQYARFKEMAERIQSEDAKELFEGAVRLILSAKPDKAQQARKDRDS